MSIEVVVKGDRISFRRWKFDLFNRTWEREIAPVVLAALKDEAPVYKYADSAPSARSGGLRDSIAFTRVGGGLGAAELVFTADARNNRGQPYAGYVIHGTREHDIRPVNFQYLHWVRDGNHNYHSFVHHPGTAANNFPERAIKKVNPEIGRTLSVICRDFLTPEQL